MPKQNRGAGRDADPTPLVPARGRPRQRPRSNGDTADGERSNEQLIAELQEVRGALTKLTSAVERLTERMVDETPVTKLRTRRQPAPRKSAEP